MSLIANALARLADIFDFNQYSNRNLIVDPAKEVWTSAVGVGVALAAGYGPNALNIVTPGTGGAGTYARANTAAAPSSRLGTPRTGLNFGSFTMTTPSTGTLAARTCPQLACRIEDVNVTEGASYTFSVYLWTVSGTVTIQQVSAIQIFGAGGSPSANAATLVPVNWVVTTIPKRYSVRIDVPSAAGKTLGTTNFGSLQVELDYPVGSTYAINDGWWQFEICSPYSSSDINGAGGAPTAFEWRGQSAEAQRTARYFQQFSLAASQSFMNVTITGTVGGFGESSIPGGPMRAVPNVTSSNTLTAFLSGTLTSVGLAATSDRTYQAAIVATGTTAFQAAFVGANAAGSTITFDARL